MSVTAKFTDQDTETLLRLVRGKLREKQRDYKRPTAVAKREAYFARPENAGKTDTSLLYMRHLQDLLTKLQATVSERSRAEDPLGEDTRGHA